MLTAPGGYPARAGWAPAGTARELDGPAAARHAVDELASQAAIIKIALNPPVGPVLDDATLAAIMETAHGKGLRVTGHVYGLEQLRRAIDAGVDELAHMLMSSEPIPESTIAEMVAAGMAVVPTLSIRTGTDLDIAIDNLHRFHAAGGTIVYGTDLGNEGPRPGIDPLEVGAMARAGISLLDIIRSATVGAARYLDLAGAGVIAPGMDADLVAFRGELSDGPGLLEKVARVWRRGRAAI
jgi:imidazolonepropionase-like amidohydrolase